MITNLTPDGIVVSRLFLWLWPRSKGVGGWGPLKESEINRYFQFWHRLPFGMHFHISHNSNNITFFSFFFLPSDDDDDDGGWLSAVW